MKTREEYYNLLVNNQYQLIAYYGYDTGYPSKEVLYSFEKYYVDSDLPFVELITGIIEKAHQLVGLSKHLDNKEAVKILIDGHIIYLCHYDFKMALTTSISRRLGYEYLINQTVQDETRNITS